MFSKDYTMLVYNRLGVLKEKERKMENHELFRRCIRHSATLRVQTSATSELLTADMFSVQEHDAEFHAYCKKRYNNTSNILIGSESDCFESCQHPTS